MKTSLRPQEISITFHTLSTSLLLLSSMEVQAWPDEETTQPWYGRAQSSNRNTATIGSDPASDKSSALFTLRNDSGHTQRMGLISGQNQIISTGSGLLVTPAMAEPGKDALNLKGSSLGAYWSLTSPAGWHVDLSASGGRVNGYSRTEQGQRQATEGNAVTAVRRRGLCDWHRDPLGRRTPGPTDQPTHHPRHTECRERHRQ